MTYQLFRKSKIFTGKSKFKSRLSEGCEDDYKKPIGMDRFFGIGFISKYLIAVTEIVVRGGESIKDTAWNLHNTI